MKVFCAAFMCLQFGFVIFWREDFGAKAAHKMLVKLTPGRCRALEKSNLGYHLTKAQTVAKEPRQVLAV